MYADAYIGRQPIFDRDMSVVGSELLYRGSDENIAEVHDDNVATSHTIVTAFLDLGIDSLVGDGVAYLNLPRELLLSSYLEALPPHKVVLEVLQNVAAEPVLVNRLRMLKFAGYKIALGNFVYRQKLAPLVELADIIKIEARHKDEMRETLKHVKSFGGRLLATHIEDPADMHVCRDLGFDLFQGYFLCRPTVERGSRMAQSRLGTMRVLAQLTDPDVDMETVESIVRADVSLSCRLLRYLNSAHFSLRSPIHDVRQALSLLGLTKLRAWVSMIAIASIDDKPPELARIAMVRARMCELLAFHIEQEPNAAFTVGLFSVLDSLLDQSMAATLDKLPLREDLNRALLGREGQLGALLTCVELHEAGDWSALGSHAFSPSELTEGYVSANRWATGALAGMH